MSERESLEVDVLVVGGGPAGLAAAYHLRQLKKDLSIAVLEKGREIGAHIISGAVMDPRGIDELMPDWKEKGGPIENPVEEDHVLFLTRKKKDMIFLDRIFDWSALFLPVRHQFVDTTGIHDGAGDDVCPNLPTFFENRNRQIFL